MIKAPTLGTSVIWQGLAYTVRDRSRNKNTGAITLWLCSCQQLECTCNTRVPLEEVKVSKEKDTKDTDASGFSDLSQVSGVNPYIATKLAAMLQSCRTYQEVTQSTAKFTPKQKAAAWKLLSQETRNQIQLFKRVYEQFPVGTAVYHKDPYMVAHIYHGKVEQVKGIQVLVRWEERKGDPIECELYEYTELVIKK